MRLIWVISARSLSILSHRRRHGIDGDQSLSDFGGVRVAPGTGICLGYIMKQLAGPVLIIAKD